MDASRHITCTSHLLGSNCETSSGTLHGKDKCQPRVHKLRRKTVPPQETTPEFPERTLCKHRSTEPPEQQLILKIHKTP